MRVYNDVYVNIMHIIYIAHIYCSCSYTQLPADSKVLTSQRLIDEIVNGSNREKYQAPWQGSFACRSISERFPPIFMIAFVKLLPRCLHYEMQINSDFTFILSDYCCIHCYPD